MPWKKANKDLIALLENEVKRFNCDRRVMFGSPTFFVNGNMFAGVHEDTVIMRLSEADREQVFTRHKEVKPFTPMGAHAMKEYAALPESLCHDAATFRHWLERSFQYARSLPPKAQNGKGKQRAS